MYTCSVLVKIKHFVRLLSKKYSSPSLAIHIHWLTVRPRARRDLVVKIALDGHGAVLVGDIILCGFRAEWCLRGSQFKGLVQESGATAVNSEMPLIGDL